MRHDSLYNQWTVRAGPKWTTEDTGRARGSARTPAPEEVCPVSGLLSWWTLCVVVVSPEALPGGHLNARRLRCHHTVSLQKVDFTDSWAY